MFRESLKMSWENIAANKMRSFLTMLGIIIGVASVIALITLVSGAMASVTAQITSLGANKLMVQVMGTPLKTGLDAADLAAIGNINGVSGVAPTIAAQTSVEARGSVKTNVTVNGGNDVYFKQLSDPLSGGRAINILDVNGNGRVAVLGGNLAKTLFYGVDPLGKDVILNGVSYTVIGVMKTQSGFLTNSVNDAVIIPYTSAMKTLGIGGITSLSVYMNDTAKSSAIVASIKNVLNGAFNYHADSFSVFNMQDMISAIGSITGMMSLLLAGIAGISLVVGGVGIMNMMLVSVTERTAEIGLRKALGAEPRSIQLQFLIESVLLSVFGGLAGVVLGLVLSFIAAKLINIPFAVKTYSVFLAVGFSAAIGIVFGLAPARKASRLNPIDALRHI